MRFEKSRRRRAGWTRRLVLALGVVLVALAGVSAAAAATASQQPPPPAPPSLDGEILFAFTGFGSTSSCSADQTLSAAGTALGPYPGTFTATVTTDPVTREVNESFTIVSPTGTVTGTKHGSNQTISPNPCTALAPTLVYTAVIHTPSGNYTDSGSANLGLAVDNFAEEFYASNGVFPTSKDQCKNGGWQNYPQFKNQGDCVSYTQNGK